MTLVHRLLKLLLPDAQWYGWLNWRDCRKVPTPRVRPWDEVNAELARRERIRSQPHPPAPPPKACTLEEAHAALVRPNPSGSFQC